MEATAASVVEATAAADFTAEDKFPELNDEKFRRWIILFLNENVKKIELKPQRE